MTLARHARASTDSLAFWSVGVFPRSGSELERVCEVDVPLLHKDLTKGRELSRHLLQQLLQKVALFTLLHVLFAVNSHSDTNSNTA